jgi:class 3 adenylate cyclase/pimeloyl-ACP methyl ester carboxylesterase
METPTIEYAHSGDVNVAYEVFGDGPIDVIIVPGGLAHLEATWEFPPFARFLERFARFARVIRFDKRGTGLSDRMSGEEPLETRMDDVRAVMDAAGSERAALCGWSEATPMCILFAATYPERVRALVLGNAFAKWTPDETHPWGPSHRLLMMVADSIESGAWGRAATLGIHSPEAAADPAFVAWWSRFERLGASPGAAAAYLRMNARIDVRNVLSAVHAPTLVVQRADNPSVSDDAAHFVADRIAGARYVEVAGVDALPYSGDTGPMLREIEEFLTGSLAVADDERILATVVFTDIVGSTERAAALGDHAWRDLLERHDTVVSREVDRCRGRVVTRTGDGAFATFDGPARAARCALAIRDSVGRLGIEVRAGLHTGEVEMSGDDVRGIAVHIGARIGSLAGPGQVLASRTVRDLVVGSNLTFVDWGTHDLKGVPDSWQLFAVSEQHAVR